MSSSRSLLKTSAGIAETTDSSESDKTYTLRDDFTPNQNSRIMMVDDESITMEVLQSFLEQAGYRKFTLVEDSVRAMDVLREQQPDILLLDVAMPEVSGFEILEQIRLDPQFQHLPVIILTSSSDALTKLQALDLGATDFLSKPVDPSELALRVRNTLAAKAYQDQLAYYDAATLLPNRILFQSRTDWAITCTRRDNMKLAIWHVTFDDFKRVADTFGPKIGDGVLRQLALRITGCLRHSDTASGDASERNSWVDVFSLGGASFAVLLPLGVGIANAAGIGQRIISAMQAPLDADGTDVYLLPSIGVAGFPDDADDTASLTRLAMGASSQAVAQGGGRIQFYSPELNDRSVQRLRMEADLRRALENEEFSLLYQPKVNVESGRVVGAEALIRWQDPERGLVLPVEFIPVTEDTGLILPIGEWVLREACSQMVRWRTQGIDISLSVNISARQFFEADLVSLVSSMLLEFDLQPSRLVLEMTESILVDRVDTALAILSQLRELGVKISIDDFGTGYSSLSYLKMFRADEVKIDRSFVMDLTSSREDQALVYAVTYLAHELGFTVCAEGVEDRFQRDYLKKIKCDEYQGYLFSRPVEPKQFTALCLQQS